MLLSVPHLHPQVTAECWAPTRIPITLPVFQLENISRLGVKLVTEMHNATEQSHARWIHRSMILAPCFNKSDEFPCQPMLFTPLCYCMLQLFTFSALYCCPSLSSKNHVKLHLLAVVLFCCLVLLYTLLPSFPDSVGFLPQQVSNNDTLLPLFPSWHLAVGLSPKNVASQNNL